MKTRISIINLLIVFLLSSACNVLAVEGCWTDHGGYSDKKIPDTRPAGNHQIDCTLILPWQEEDKPEVGSFPIIGWANGWGWNEVAGENEIDGYKPGLIDWAVDGQFIVIAANQWSPRERDVLQCVSWLVEQNLEGGEYEGLIDTSRIGLSGHSQGGGAVLRAADGKPKGKGLNLDLDITTVVPMNPYGPSWNEVKPDGPVLIVGGANDTTTPPHSYEKAWRQIEKGPWGGINAILEDGDHNNNAWIHGMSENVDENGNSIPCLRDESNFGKYQKLTLHWWQILLNENDDAIGLFCDELINGEGDWVVTGMEEDLNKSDCNALFKEQ